MARRMISATNQDWYWLGAYAGAQRQTSALSIGISWSPRSRRTMPKNQQALDVTMNVEKQAVARASRGLVMMRKLPATPAARGR